MKKLHVLLLMHEDLVPPDDLAGSGKDDIREWKTEYDVQCALRDLGHECLKLGVRDELRPIRDAVEQWKPDVVFNLLEEFRGESVFDVNVAAYLELLGAAYTGCGPRGLLLARDKALSKKILSYHRLRVPQFQVFRMGKKSRRAKRLPFPLIVKSVAEDASLGIAQASVVRDDAALEERVRFVHERIGTDAIAERFIEGREIYVAVLGNERLTVFPAQELLMERKDPDAALIATARAKHDLKYQAKLGVTLRAARLPQSAERELARLSRRIYRLLGLDGYARIDFRLDAEGRPYFLEANPNPDIAASEEVAEAARAAGLQYDDLIQRILNLGVGRGKRGES